MAIKIYRLLVICIPVRGVPVEVDYPSSTRFQRQSSYRRTTNFSPKKRRNKRKRMKKAKKLCHNTATQVRVDASADTGIPTGSSGNAVSFPNRNK
jgi:hypothetical protein